MALRRLLLTELALGAYQDSELSLSEGEVLMPRRWNGGSRTPALGSIAAQRVDRLKSSRLGRSNQRFHADVRTIPLKQEPKDAMRPGMKATLAAVAVTAIVAIARPSAADFTLTRAGTWELRVKAVAVACLAGSCTGDSDRRTETVLLPAGSIVRMQAQVWSCQLDLADYGTFVPGKRGKVKVKIVDRDELGQVVRQCSPYSSLRLGKVTGSERLAPDGGSFDSKVKIRANIEASGRTVGLTVTAKVNGLLVAESSSAIAGESGLSAPPALRLGVDAVVDRLLRR